MSTVVLDANYIVTADLESYFVDKDTGLPLSYGIVYFKKDQDHASLKTVYQFSGTAGQPVYTALPNPCYLSAQGTFQDALGNNIVPYYYIADATGNTELYYVEVYNQNGVLQFVRNAWPNFTSADTQAQDNINFIPNGQFIAHNDTAAQAKTTVTENSVSLDVSHVAQGGWDMYISHGFTGVYTATFSQITTPRITGLNDFPRWSLTFNCTTADVEQVRDIRIKWNDVNQFEAASTPGTQFYTLLFACSSPTPVQMQIILCKYYGAGGSAYTEEVKSTITVSNGWTYQNVLLQFGDNNGKTIGTNGDDYVAIAFRPANQTFHVSLTDVGLFIGQNNFAAYPTITNAQMLSQAIAGTMTPPQPDGSNLYLPMVLTPTGVTFDASDIGKVRAGVTTDSTPISATTNELLCNGDVYSYTANSPLGIPYSRLGSKLYDSTLNQFLFGTGSKFVQTYINSGATSELILVTNQPTIQTTPANGGTSPGFTYGTLFAGTTSLGYNAYFNANAVVSVISTFTAPTNGGANFTTWTSGMTFHTLRNNALSGMYKMCFFTALSAAALGNGAGVAKYFTFSNTTTNYYVWFKTATETDPAPGGTGIQVNLELTMTAVEVAAVIANALSSHQVNTITCAAGAGIPAGAFFTMYANLTPYNVWYRLNGAGTAPPTNPIPVDITGAETAAQIASKTMAAINKYQFAVPDLRGVTLRGLDNAASPIWDLEVAKRWSLVGSTVTNPGTMQIDDFMDHNHPGSVAPGDNKATVNSTHVVTTDTTALNATLIIAEDGGVETRVVNMAVNYWIKY